MTLRRSSGGPDFDWMGSYRGCDMRRKPGGECRSGNDGKYIEIDQASVPRCAARPLSQRSSSHESDEMLSSELVCSVAYCIRSFINLSITESTMNSAVVANFYAASSPEYFWACGKVNNRLQARVAVVRRYRPVLALGPWGLPHPAQNGPLRDLKAEHLQFTVDPRRAPAWVLRYHAEDEVAQFPAHAFSSCLGLVSRQPAPICLKSGSMPSGISA